MYVRQTCGMHIPNINYQDCELSNSLAFSMFISHMCLSAEARVRNKLPQEGNSFFFFFKDLQLFWIQNDFHWISNGLYRLSNDLTVTFKLLLLGLWILLGKLNPTRRSCHLTDNFPVKKTRGTITPTFAQEATVALMVPSCSNIT